MSDNEEVRQRPKAKSFNWHAFETCVSVLVSCLLFWTLLQLNKDGYIISGQILDKTIDCKAQHNMPMINYYDRIKAAYVDEFLDIAQLLKNVGVDTNSEEYKKVERRSNLVRKWRDGPCASKLIFFNTALPTCKDLDLDAGQCTTEGITQRTIENAFKFNPKAKEMCSSKPYDHQMRCIYQCYLRRKEGDPDFQEGYSPWKAMWDGSLALVKCAQEHGLNEDEIGEISSGEVMPEDFYEGYEFDSSSGSRQDSTRPKFSTSHNEI